MLHYGLSQIDAAEFPKLREYSIHGLRFASEIDLPELPLAKDSGAERVDFEITYGKVPVSFPYRFKTAEGYFVGDDQAFFRVKGVARYLLDRGDRIVVNPVRGANPEQVRLALYGVPLSVIAFQKGLMPVHASAVVIDGKAVIFPGFTMHGKSTLAATFAKLGHLILSDDKIVVRFDAQGFPQVFPGAEVITLTDASARNCGKGRNKPVSDVRRFGKLSYASSEHFETRPIPLAAIMFPEWADEECIEITPIDRFDTMIGLRSNLWAGDMMWRLGLEQRFVDWAEAVVAAIPGFTLTRNKDLARLENVAQAVIAKFRALRG